MRLLIAVVLAVFPMPHYWFKLGRLHKVHYNRSVASWYEDAGSTASGRHYLYGFASLMFGSEWGKRVRFCYGHRCVTGQLDDHGPYVGGRSFDLNQTLAGALSFSGVHTVRWRVL